MKSLEYLLNGVEVLHVQGDLETQVSQITLDSRTIKPGGLFIAIKGAQADGHQFIPNALAQGAGAIISENSNIHPHDSKVVWIQVADSRKALGIIAAHFYDSPSQELQLIGVTGTNGKTSVVYLLYQIYLNLGYVCGLISTIDIIWAEQRERARLTTPDVIQLNALLRKMADAGCSHVFMEVSSHAAHQGRIDGLSFKGGVFTNLTHDHLDYHGTFLEYLNAKKLFFDHLSKSSFALINEDDRHSKVMVQNTAAQISTYGLKHLSDYKGRILENRLDGLVIRLNDKTISCRLSGEFNAYNLLAAFGTARLLGEDESEVLSALSDCHPVSGRMEIIHDGMGRTGIVDFAHTPDALEKVLRTVNALKDTKRKVILVCGCGGDRDTSKRPVMGAIASSLADIVCFTSDNPRSENPETILHDMMAGVLEAHKSKVQIITSREQAIQIAVRLAGPGDVVIVAGKGHEDYQEIQGKRFPFDDKMVLKAALETTSILNRG